jgi:quercetin dioxygenase-like cupin family protein
METVVNLPKIVPAGAGTKYDIMGHEVTVKMHSSDASDVLIFELISPPGAGIPFHVHSREDEFIRILEGEFTVTMGEEVFVAKAGDQLNFLRNIPHGYVNTGTIPTRSLWLVTPGKNQEHFFDALKLFPPGPPDLARIAKLNEEHGQQLLITY